MRACFLLGRRTGSVSPRSFSNTTLWGTELVALALYTVGSGLTLFAFLMSLIQPISKTRKTGYLSKDAFWVEYPTLLGLNFCSGSASVINIVALNNLYYNQMIDAYEAIGRLGPAPKYEVFHRRILVSWAVWIDLLARIFESVAYSYGAIDGLVPGQLAIPKHLQKWISGFTAAVASMLFMSANFFLIANARDPWYTICVPVFVYRAQAKLAGLTIGCAFWGGFWLAMGCLGLFELSFWRLLVNTPSMPFTASFGIASFCFAFSSFFAVIGFIKRDNDNPREIKSGLPLALNLSILKALEYDNQPMYSPHRNSSRREW